MEKPYLAELDELKRVADGIPDTRMMAAAKVFAMAKLNMRWERLMVDPELSSHPWPLVTELVRDALAELRSWPEIAFIEDAEATPIGTRAAEMEDRHHSLFQSLWLGFDESEYEGRIERYVYRLEINGLADGFLEGKRCIDFGCGHGNFAHALLRKGAEFVLGIDYGEASIRYARAARDRLRVAEDRLRFRVESVYEVSEPDSTFDFAIQNGVFHHLEDENRAYREVHRVLRPGGGLWAYTDGAGGVGYDLWDASVHVLREVPHAFVLECLDFVGVETGKRYHLGDGLNATYRHTSWDELVGRLGDIGFDEFRRLAGGFPTDLDGEALERDPWAREKFGEGDLRLLAPPLAGRTPLRLGSDALLPAMHHPRHQAGDRDRHRRRLLGLQGACRGPRRGRLGRARRALQ